MIFWSRSLEFVRTAMITDTPTLTVDNICKLALPLGTVTVAGGEALSRPVRWAISINADSPVPYLEGDELVLLIPGKSDTTPAVRACIEANVAAMVTLSALSPIAIAAAEMAHVSVLQLPAGSHI